MVEETKEPPSLDYLDTIPSTLPPCRQRVFSRNDLEIFNLIEAPCWVFDVRQKAIWWANDAGVNLWSADSLEDLLARDFAVGMSKASANSMLAWLEKFHRGETNRTTWTFHPNHGKDGPITCDLQTSGIFVNSKTVGEEVSGEPWFCMLVVVEKMVRGEERTKKEATMLRRTEMLRHFPIIARQFNFEGNLMDQNPEALSVFGSPLNALPSDAVAPAPRQGRGLAAEDDATTCSATTADTTPLSDFLAQFVDLEEGKQVWEEAKEGNDYSTETLQWTVSGKSWFSIDVRRCSDPVTSEKVIIFSARDVSKLMKYAREQVEKQNQARNEFFAVMAHEIKTPLHQVIGSMELLLQSKLDEDQMDNTVIMQTSAKAMMAIIDDALDFTKLEAGKLSIERLQFEVRGVVNGCIAAFQQQLERKGLRILMIVDEQIPAWLVGDPNRLRQVLMNMVSNAVKFSSKGTIEVQAKRLLDNCSNQVVLHFSVTDPGIGISERKQGLVFDAYQQADTSVSRKYGGTGLGLSICKSLVDLMGGQIGVESELRKGSKFWFEIPFQQYDSAASQEPATTGKDADVAYRVLVVEDNKVNQKVICKMLQRLGHSTTVAENGQLGVEALKHKSSDSVSPEDDRLPYDLVLMDWQMPVMDGIEATEEIRRMGYTKTQLPVIGLTASILGKHWLDAGMNECLKKPIRLNELKSALSRNMTKRDHQ